MKPEPQDVSTRMDAVDRGARAYVHRDARINELHAGTSEIQRLAVARNENGLR